jgi:transposase
MAAQRKYPDELRERAVKMLFEVREREGKGHGELARDCLSMMRCRRQPLW